MPSVFTQIMNDELPGHYVWEDELAIVIMTIQPIRPGHVLVIPRAEINHWDDLPPDLAAHLMTLSQQVAKAIKQIFPSKRVGLSIVGIEVPHTHIHLCPINQVNDLSFSQAGPESAENLAQYAQQLNAAMQTIMANN